MKNICYYGRSDFKTINEGDELCWVIGNRIGGFSNSMYLDETLYFNMGI